MGGGKGKGEVGRFLEEEREVHRGWVGTVTVILREGEVEGGHITCNGLISAVVFVVVESTSAVGMLVGGVSWLCLFFFLLFFCALVATGVV